MPDLTSVVKFFARPFESTAAMSLGGTIAPAATTVPVNGMSNYSDNDVVVFAVDPTTTAKQVFTGTKSGSNVVNAVWTEGTNVAHTAGATVIDYVSATTVGMISKGLQVEHNEDGTHGAVTATSVVASGAVTGTGGTLTTSNIVTPTIKGQWDGWIAANETLTYASATTFTCSSALAAIFTTGDKVKLTQTTAKYFYVVSVSGTTVTVTGGADYTLANAAITLPFYSKSATPLSFPTGGFNYTPTFANLTVGNGTHASKITMKGKTVFYDVLFTLGSTSAVGSNPTFTLPVTSASLNTAQTVGNAIYYNTSAWHNGFATWATTTTATMRNWDGNNDSGAVTATVPFGGGWLTSYVISVRGSYEAA